MGNSINGTKIKVWSKSYIKATECLFELKTSFLSLVEQSGAWWRVFDLTNAVYCSLKLVWLKVTLSFYLDLLRNLALNIYVKF